MATPPSTRQARQAQAEADLKARNLAKRQANIAKARAAKPAAIQRARDIATANPAGRPADVLPKDWLQSLPRYARVIDPNSRKPMLIGRDTHARALAKAYTPEALMTLVSIATNGMAPPAARVSAAQAILDRGWGRPITPVAVASTQLGDAELAELTLAILQQRGGALPMGGGPPSLPIPPTAPPSQSWDSSEVAGAPNPAAQNPPYVDILSITEEGSEEE